MHVYYGLSSFYQNNRKYARAREDRQLAGRYTNPADMSSCIPLLYPPNQTNMSYAPCGAFANSIFTDRFSLYFYENGLKPNSISQIWPFPQMGQRVKLNKKGIAWPTDRSKFANPSEPFDPKKWVPPRDWYDIGLIYGNDSDDVSANDTSQYGFENEDLIIWMRTAALPTFRKLFRYVDHSTAPFDKSLPNGAYSLLVNYSAI